jgi:N-acetylmuramoyl-L-alanine amidase
MIGKMWDSTVCFFKGTSPMESKVLRIAIVVGHEAKRPGMTLYNKTSEYFWNRDIAQEVVKKYTGKHIVNVFYRDHVGLAGVAKQVGSWNADVVIELHLNASGIESARGCEALALMGEADSAKLAKDICALINKKFKIRIRRDQGLLAVKSKDRGALNLRAYKDAGIKRAILVEPFFADFKTEESHLLVEKPSLYSDMLIQFLDTIV